MQAPADIRIHQAQAPLFTGPRGPWLEHLVQDEGVSMETAFEILAPWEMLPVVDEKRGHMATIIKRNKEVHLAVFRRFRNRAQVSVRRLTEILKPLLDKEVFLVTKVGKDEDSRFLERLGFEPLGVTMDGLIRTFILNEIRMPRTNTHINQAMPRTRT